MSDFRQRLRETIVAAKAEAEREDKTRRDFNDAWFEACITLLSRFQITVAALAEVGITAEARRLNGGLHLFWASHEIRIEWVSGTSVTWTERHGDTWEVPEGLRPKPLNLDWWEIRLCSFVEKCVRTRE